MAGMGPPPKPADQRRRRNAVPGTVYLPANGRKGRTPPWPLPKPVRQADGIHDLELSMWHELWATPQASAWERLKWTRDVAQYVRWKVLAELGDIDAAKEARQLSDRLGLTPLALLRLRWEITTDEVQEQRSDRASSRNRLKAV